jgi:hypothetical protein
MHKPMWNDGPALPDFMGSDGAPAIARKHLCSGGGGGQTVGAPPDYSQYIADMTKTGHTLQGYGADLYNWAQQQGINLQSIAQGVGTAATTAATGQQGTSDTTMQNWQQQSQPLYGAQAADASNMIKNLPQTEESYAGKYGADAATGIDQQLQAEQRQQTAMGISPGVASTALDTQARIGRAAATTAAAEQGRMQARTEARNVTTNALQTEQGEAGVGGQQAGLATANRTQAVQAPETAASTTAGLYSPSMGYYNSAEPYVQQWGQTMATGYNQELQQQNLNAQNSDGGFMSTILPLAGGIAGSFFGPMGSAIGSSLGSAAGGAAAKAATGGRIRGRRIPRFAGGGAIDTGPPPMGGDDPGHFVDPSLSPSGGQNTDDVHAMVQAGEFVVPERTVDWYGEKFFQNLIAKADGDQQKNTVAAPEEHQMPPGAMAAMDTSPPQFRSEGART